MPNHFIDDSFLRTIDMFFFAELTELQEAQKSELHYILYITGLTQIQLAELFSVSPQSIRKWLHGDHNIPELFLRILRVLPENRDFFNLMVCEKSRLSQLDHYANKPDSARKSEAVFISALLNVLHQNVPLLVQMQKMERELTIPPSSDIPKIKRGRPPNSPSTKP
jgi:transcriptional regulator with XRE-family HTH domain